MRYQGSCHCGGIAFEVEGEVDSGLACNCSICHRRGSLLWFVPRSALTLKTPTENMSTYTFNQHVVKHLFCSTCGIHPFGEGMDPQGNEVAAINLRCLQGFDLDSVPVHTFDGRAI
jgi:hypothetical protein